MNDDLSPSRGTAALHASASAGAAGATAVTATAATAGETVTTAGAPTRSSRATATGASRGGAPADSSSDALPRARAYAGPERRRHVIYVTRNTEYHVRHGRCVAVRDRRKGEMLHGHLALDRCVQGGLKFFQNGAMAPNPGAPRAGEAIYFAGGGRELVTSPLEAVRRPRDGDDETTRRRGR